MKKILIIVIGFSFIGILFSHAEGATPNILEILSYGGDITFIQGNGMEKMIVVGPSDFAWASANDINLVRNHLSFISNQGSQVLAPVHIPDGATITEVESALVDQDSDEDVVCRLLEDSFSGDTHITIAEISSSGAVFDTIRFFSETGLSHVVDRDTNFYQAEYRDINCDAGCVFTQ